MPRRTPRITIGVPVYNGEKTVGPTLEGLLSQTFGDFLLLISDNASEDGTREVCEGFVRRDDRVRYLRQSSNLGVVGNVNGLLQRGESELFMWHAVDDLSKPRLLEVCVAALDARPEAVLAYVEAELIDETGRVLPESHPPLDLGSRDVVRRFEQCLDPMVQTENVIYGLMRHVVALRTQRHGNFAGGDRAFCAELTLYGPFARVDEKLFQRRVPSRIKSPEELEQYNTARLQSIPLREWRILRHNIASIFRAPASASQRARLLAAQLRRLRREPRAYLGELRILAANALRR